MTKFWSEPVALKNAKAQVIHRLRRRSRQRLFADLNIKAGDRIHVYFGPAGGVTARIKDFDWQMSGERRFVILDNGLHVRVGADAIHGAPHWRKVRR